MIYNYPYFGFPNYMNNMYQAPQNMYNTTIKKNVTKPVYPKNKNNDYSKMNNNYSKSYNHYNDYNNIQSHYNEDHSKRVPLFNILGISLYYDDVLLVCMIIFLYNENIRDNDLLLSLILLLLS